MKRINNRSSSQARKGNEINILPIKEEISTILYPEVFVVEKPSKIAEERNVMPFLIFVFSFMSLNNSNQKTTNSNIKIYFPNRLC